MAVNMIDSLSLDSYSKLYDDNAIKENTVNNKKQTDSFDSILSSIMNSVEETNALQNKAEEAEIQFALGQSDNTHDLLVAETKASVALQYTVAVRDKMIEAYKELMQMQV